MSRIAPDIAWPIRSSLRTCSDPRGGPLQLAPGEQLLEDVARVGEADDGHVARVRNVVAEQHAHDAQLDLALGPAVDHRVAPRLEDPEEAVVAALEDAALDQPGERLVLDRVGVLPGALHPVARAVRLPAGDVGQRRIEEAVAGRQVVEQDQVLEVGVDAVLHRQVHQYGAGDGVVPRPTGHPHERPVVVAKHEQDDFLDESQHGACPLTVVRVLRRGSRTGLGPPPRVWSRRRPSIRRLTGRHARGAARGGRRPR